MIKKPPQFDNAIAYVDAYVDDEAIKIVGKKLALVELLKKKSKVIDRIKDIYSMYNMPADWMNRLPAKVFKETYKSLKDLDENINYFELRSKLREEHEKSTIELEKLESEIAASKLELLLGKIDILQKKLDI